MNKSIAFDRIRSNLIEFDSFGKKLVVQNQNAKLGLKLLSCHQVTNSQNI